MRLGLGFGRLKAKPLALPIPTDPPPEGFVYLTGPDGAYLRGADGAFLLGPA